MDRARIGRVAGVGRLGFSPPLAAVPLSALVLTSTTFRVVFSRAVTTPDPTGFSVTTASSDSPINGVAGSGTATLTFTTDGSTPILTGDAVLFSYDAGTGGATETASGVALRTVTSFAVTNPL